LDSRSVRLVALAPSARSLGFRSDLRPISRSGREIRFPRRFPRQGCRCQFPAS
jgi:hypothetical protein